MAAAAMRLAVSTRTQFAPMVRASVYEGAAQTRRTLGWSAPTSTPNDGILGSLTTLRDRSRAARRNDVYAKSAIEKLVANLIGTGIQPLAKSTVDVTMPHPVTGEIVPFRIAIQALWQIWTDESDADGLLDFYGQQTQATRGWIEGGEVFARLRLRRPEDGLSVPLQVQLIEPELCPHTYSTTTPSGNHVRGGIEFDPIGRRVAHYFWQTRPGGPTDIDYSELRRVSADSVVHLYDPLRPGQLRGLPLLVATLIRLYSIDKMEDATLFRHELGNMFLGVRTRPPAAENGVLHPLTGREETDTDDRDRPILRFEPGIIQDLEPGEELEFNKPPDPAATYPDFIRQQLRGACAAAEVPYELVTGDMSGLNDRTMRVILNDFRRRLMAWQHQIVVHLFCRPIWNAFVDRVFLSGALPMPVSYLENPAAWRAVKWMPQGWAYIHPVQDVQAEKEAVRDGFKSRTAVVSERGDDAEEIDSEQAVDNERADRLKLRHDSDGRFAAKPTAPATADEQSAGALA